MQYLIFTFALISAFSTFNTYSSSFYDPTCKSGGSFNSNLELCITPAPLEQSYQCILTHDGQVHTLSSPKGFVNACKNLLSRSKSFLPEPTYTDLCSGSYCTNTTKEDYYKINTSSVYLYTRFNTSYSCAPNKNCTPPPNQITDKYRGRANHDVVLDIPSCPPQHAPDYTTPITHMQSDFCSSQPIYPERDPDCPATSENDIYVFGLGSKTNVCYPAPNGRQCSIETNDNGDYLLPISYGSSEPVTCVEDYEPDPEKPDPTPDPEQPDDSPDPDKTPDPEPKPEPDPTDDTDKTESIDALNQVNDNLNTINNNINSNAESHNERLDRMAKETQNSNELLASIKQNTSAITTNTGNTSLELGKSNDLLYGIKKAIDRTNDNLEQKIDPECIGELCEFDIEGKLSEEDLKITEWFEETIDVDPKIKSFNQKLLSYVSQNFAGFTGTCQPFVLDVSIANTPKLINVSQHCEPYETYFKPLVEWLLWTFTAIALINISSQSFRAFSSL